MRHPHPVQGRRLRLGVLGLLAAVTLTPAVAYPCGNSMRFRLHRAVQQVAQAERLLDEGKPEEALTRAEQARALPLDAQLSRRVQLVEAVARVRTGRLALAMPVLRARLQAEPTSPVLRARMAEALMRAQKSAAALAMLEDLERRDLMPDAHAFATLAALRGQRGDLPGRDRALARCELMAAAKRICGGASSPAPGPAFAQPPAPRS